LTPKAVSSIALVSTIFAITYLWFRRGKRGAHPLSLCVCVCVCVCVLSLSLYLSLSLCVFDVCMCGV
jgi:hypothetical protein